jgi:CRP-like cAMP-binding protein
VKSPLFTLLSGIVPLSEAFEKALTTAVVPLSLPNRYMLLESPKVSDHAYYIESGYVMTYTFFKGKKQVGGFFGPGQILFSPLSFFAQVPSKEFFQSMSAVELLCFSFQNVQQLLADYPEANQIQRAVMLEYFEREREKMHDSVRLHTAERHEKLIKRVPWIEQVIPQESIASYLGITPQTLSRIKKEASRR